MFAVAGAALTWLSWWPLLAFARGMLGNAAVVAGRGDLHLRAQLLGAVVRIVAAIVLTTLFGFRGAIASLLLAELAPIAMLFFGMRRPRRAATPTG